MGWAQAHAQPTIPHLGQESVPRWRCPEHLVLGHRVQLCAHRDRACPAGAAHPIEETWRRGAAAKVDEGSAAGEHASLNENQATTCSRSRAPLRLTSKGSLMPASTHSSDGVITKPSSKSGAQTIDGLRG